MQTIFSLLLIRRCGRLIAGLAIFFSAISLCYGQKLDEQCKDCPCLVRLAKPKAQQKLYSEAIRLYNAARTCDPTQALLIDARVAEIFQTISNLRDEADRQRRIAEQAAAEAEQVGLQLLDAVAKAEKEARKAKDEKARADSLAGVALLEKETVQRQRDSMRVLISTTVNSYCNTVEKLIYELNYDLAGTLLLEALLLDYARKNSPYYPKPTPQHEIESGNRAKKLALEMIFFYGQTGNLDMMLSFTRMFEEFRWVSKLEQIDAALAQNDSARYAQLLERYYPKTVPVDESFSIGQTEVTFWQYALFATDTQRELFQPAWRLQGNFPAVGVSWWDAVDYCTWLNSKRQGAEHIEQTYKHVDRTNDNWTVIFVNERIVWVDKKAKGYRLPFNREWLKAAGFYTSSGQLPPKDSSDITFKVKIAVWHLLNSGFMTRPVGISTPNNYEVYDLAGNAREWVWKDEDKTKFTYNPNHVNNRSQVLKGGSWNSTPNQCNPSSRILMKTDVRMNENGFRVVLSHGRQ